MVMGFTKKLDLSDEQLSAIKTALESLQEPNFKQSLGDLGFIQGVATAGKKLRIDLSVPTPALLGLEALKETLSQKAAELGNGCAVDVQVTANVRSAVGGAFSAQSIPGVKNIILIASGKGGVGKSTVASNVAVSLAEMGAQVGLLDADMYGPSAPTMFGVPASTRPASIPGPNPERPVMVPLSRFGIKLISIGFLVDTATPMIWRGPMLASASMQLFKEVHWEELDYLVVDLPPGTGDIQLTIAQQVAVAGAVIVSTPQDVALADVVRAKAMFDKVNIPSLGVVENMSYFICDSCDKRHEIFTSGGAEKAAGILNLPFLGDVPIEGNVRAGGDEGAPVVVRNPDTQSAAALKLLAQRVATQLAIRAQSLTGDVAIKGPKLTISGGMKSNESAEKKGLPIIN